MTPSLPLGLLAQVSVMDSAIVVVLIGAALFAVCMPSPRR